MNPVQFRFTAMVFTTLLALAACGRNIPSGPPSVHYGQDVCTACGMIVSDDRFAAAIVNPAPDAPAALFDDVGCLLDYEKSNSAANQWPHYSHDANSHKWVTAAEAFFVTTTRETPMGSGIFVFQSRAEADAFAKQSNTKPETYAELSHRVAIVSASSNEMK